MDKKHEEVHVRITLKQGEFWQGSFGFRYGERLRSPRGDYYEFSAGTFLTLLADQLVELADWDVAALTKKLLQVNPDIFRKALQALEKMKIVCLLRANDRWGQSGHDIVDDNAYATTHHEFVIRPTNERELDDQCRYRQVPRVLAPLMVFTRSTNGTYEGGELLLNQFSCLARALTEGWRRTAMAKCPKCKRLLLPHFDSNGSGKGWMEENKKRSNRTGSAPLPKAYYVCYLCGQHVFGKKFNQKLFRNPPKEVHSYGGGDDTACRH